MRLINKSMLPFLDELPDLDFIMFSRDEVNMRDIKGELESENRGYS